MRCGESLHNLDGIPIGLAHAGNEPERSRPPANRLLVLR
jgi:hypothetical protein